MSDVKIYKYQLGCNATEKQVKAIDGVAVVDASRAHSWADFLVITTREIDWQRELPKTMVQVVEG